MRQRVSASISVPPRKLHACVAVTIAVFSLSFICKTRDARAADRAADKRPNVVVIVADDLGYADLGFQGSKDLLTPNLDRLASGGVRCTNAYVSCPVCSPTRAGLLTGRYQQRFGHEFNPGPPSQSAADFGLPLTEVTLADRLKAAGYATGMVGKWHLGYEPKFAPQQRGFQEFFGFLAGAHSYSEWTKDARGAILRGEEPTDEKMYLTDAFGREAGGFIASHRAEPFFLYLPFNAVHLPAEATQKYLERFASIKNPKRRTYAAMLSAMDDAVGEVLNALDSAKVTENTIVFFLSDNGGPPANGSLNTPLRGAKSMVYEGGIRVPMVVRWPGHIPANSVCDQPIISLDIFPTALAAAGVDAAALVQKGKQPLDGVNILPLLEGRSKEPPHAALYWRFGQAHAIRKGNLKLLKTPTSGVELYDLSSDVAEANDLAAAQPEQVAKLQKDYDAWNAELAKPRWSPRGGGGRKARAAADAD